MTQEPPTSAVDARLREVLALHFDPAHGTPYWLEQLPRLGFDPRERIRTVADLPALGPMNLRALRARPLRDFVPRCFAAEPSKLVPAQTGGTSGAPIWTAYSTEEFQAAFVIPFLDAARQVGFPAGEVWLYVGPSGPHVIGRAAEAIARGAGAMPPFTVDFDPRWAAKLLPGSFAATRYLSHVVEQALAVLATQAITVLFSTPPVLRALGNAMTSAQRHAIRGVHYGGLALAREELRDLQENVFPQAVHLAGYGNTLFGCCLELCVAPGRMPTYYPHGDRLVFGVVPHPRSGDTDQPVYLQAGASGRLVFSRLDQTMFLANVLERDRGELVAPLPAPETFRLVGVRDPAPIEDMPLRAAAALY